MKKMTLSERLNVLRAGVLGANDGIVSVAGIVIGVAGAGTSTLTILISGVAGLLAGALSMAGGEYVSVSTQKDTEKSLVAKEEEALHTDYQGELEKLIEIYKGKGLSHESAEKVAEELMKNDALGVQAQEVLGFKLNDYANPFSAALSSLFAFSIGAILPLLTIVLLPESIRIWFTFIAVLIALAITGYTSAYLGNAPTKPAVLRNCLVGMLTMIITYVVGHYVGI
ncbi:membrane protein [Listeria floridensis FSL S10-1187]|uniref:Membrane protein n=1 Tax=Listeria floridensis FSL S10-1187 TaxID=1265817 RepID=A0ABN0RD98_9LIST|nr:VIT family protein [Listeria floridensis]EUJ28852.1 membrane protein [Listeria floridensis FSL S10-1187]